MRRDSDLWLVVKTNRRQQPTTVVSLACERALIVAFSPALHEVLAVIERWFAAAGSCFTNNLRSIRLNRFLHTRSAKTTSDAFGYRRRKKIFGSLI